MGATAHSAAPCAKVKVIATTTLIAWQARYAGRITAATFAARQDGRCLAQLRGTIRMIAAIAHLARSSPTGTDTLTSRLAPRVLEVPTFGTALP